MTSRVASSASTSGTGYGAKSKAPVEGPRPAGGGADANAEEADLRLVIEEADEPEGYVYTVIDRRTGRVVNRLKREELLRLREDQGYAAGSLIASKA